MNAPDDPRVHTRPLRPADRNLVRLRGKSEANHNDEIPRFRPLGGGAS